MLQRTRPYLKKKFTLHPRSGRSGAKNLAWRPKIPLASLQQFDFSFNLESPGRIPQAWNAKECARLGLQAWPKEVGFYNAGDNFELTPEMHLRLFRKNHNSEFWTQDHNEKTIISLMPLVEEKPKEAMPLVTEVFQAHLSRFGADHIIYNAVMQARAFTKDVDGTMALFKEMQTLGLEPNAQSYINVILAMQLAGKPKAAALDFFTQAVTSGAMPAVVRIDTEFEMWWCQLERMGSFTSQRGYLSNKEEGAVPLPRDPFAIWGWSRDERKFVPEDIAVRAEVSRRTRSDGMAGTVFSNVRRAPWFKYRGFKRYDFKGPRSTPNAEDVNLTAPAPRQNPYLPRATSE